jgi:predicted Zn-dependent peptidase
VVSIKFTILGGSSAEEPSQRGAAHLLAVSSLAGTNKRSGLRLTRDLENLGARIVTSADKQKISVTVTALADKIEKAVQGVCEAIIHPPSSAFAILDLKDTAVLAYEAASEPVSVARDLLHEAAFGDESPLGSTFLPSKREFDELSLENVLAYRAKTFVASNVVVTASGVSLATLKALLETHLHELPKGAGKVVPASPYIGGDVKVKADLGGRTVMGLGFPVSGSVGSALLVKDVLIGKHKNVTASLDVYTAGGLLSFVIDGASPQDATATLEAVVADIKHLGSGSPAVEALRKQVGD